MELRSHFLTDREKRIICSWRYGGEFAVYDLPPFGESQEKAFGFLDPRQAENYRAYYDGKTLVAYTQLLEQEREVFLRVAVAPDLCGRGYGQTILAESCALSRQLYPDKPLYMEVRTWNRRAIRCFERAGFAIDGPPYEQETSLGPGTFYRMTQTKQGETT